MTITATTREGAYIEGHTKGFADGAASTVDDELVRLRALRSAWVDVLADLDLDIPDGTDEGALPALVAAEVARLRAGGALGDLRVQVGVLAALNVEVLDRLATVVFSRKSADFADVEDHVEATLDEMVRLAERLGGAPVERTEGDR